MPAPKMLSGLPKPLLFGLYGAVGGLFGALIFGELIWSLLKPPPALPAAPQVAVSASATVQVYPKSENVFPVQIVRERFDASVTVQFGLLPVGMSISPITFAPGQTTAQATVTTTSAVSPGEYKLSLTADANVDAKPVTAANDFKVVVLQTPAPPPALAVAVPPNLSVYKKGTGKFTVSVARRSYNGPVAVTVAPLPAGVTAAPATIPADATDTEVTLTATDAAALGSATLTVSAEAGAAKLKAEASTLLAVSSPPVAPVDIVFVLDVTASMQWAIDDLKNGIGKFAGTLAKNQVNFRLGLVTFRDISIAGETVDVIEFKDKEVFTADGAVFREKVGTLKASGGGDIPESSLEAVVEASKMPYRQGTTKILLLITDAPPKIRDVSVEATGTAVKDAGIDSVHLVIQKLDLDAYKPLMAAGTAEMGGKYFNLGDVVRGDDGFDGLLETFGKVVTAAAFARSPDAKPLIAPPPDPPKVAASAAVAPKAAEAAPAPAIKSLQSRETAAAGSEKRVVIRSGVWAGAIAAFVCLALLAGQHHYLRGELPAVGGAAMGLLGGLIVGLIGGAAGQGLYLLAPDGSRLGTVFQVLGWTLLGGLAGAGLSVFIPNMKVVLGLLGGALGGAAGAVGFLLASSIDEIAGRLVGGLLLGFCIGLMVAIVEAAFRRAWLEVRYGARETITVTLGPEPVKIGGDAKACTVWARGAAPLALRFFVRNGNVICDDAVMKREAPAADGFSKEVGNVTVTVRTGSGTTNTPAASPPPPPKPTKTAPAKPTPSRVPSDDEYDSLPMPMSPPPAPPANLAAPLSLDVEAAPLPPPPPPVPVAKPSVPPLKPVATKPPAPVAPPKPKPPATPAVAKDPNACPGCGRGNAGKPKQRYCMVCDNTY
ncbi:MAG: VWA domain-containing protein [Planctomycetes bacterium]|nr:VWA domain-containing protein [Planctomycetota bacterium]